MERLVKCGGGFEKKKDGIEPLGSADLLNELGTESKESSSSSGVSKEEEAKGTACSSPPLLGWPIRKAGEVYKSSVSGKKVAADKSLLEDLDLKKINSNISG